MATESSRGESASDKVLPECANSSLAAMPASGGTKLKESNAMQNLQGGYNDRHPELASMNSGRSSGNSNELGHVAVRRACSRDMHASGSFSEQLCSIRACFCCSRFGCALDVLWTHWLMEARRTFTSADLFGHPDHILYLSAPFTRVHTSRFANALPRFRLPCYVRTHRDLCYPTHDEFHESALNEVWACTSRFGIPCAP